MKGSGIARPQVGELRQADLRSYIAAWERPDSAVFGVTGVYPPHYLLSYKQGSERASKQASNMPTCQPDLREINLSTGHYLYISIRIGSLPIRQASETQPLGTVIKTSLTPLTSLTDLSALDPYCAGDFDAVAMKKLVEKTLGTWHVADKQPAHPSAIPNPALPPQSTDGQVRANQHH